MTERILIIDDDIDTLKLVGLMLERQGYEIIVASNGTHGLAKARTEQPDLILLDVMMPDLDGYEVTRRLRSDPEVAHIPIIMFTAKTMVDDKVAGFESGVDDYLTKPTHPAELSAHVKAVLARSAQARSGGEAGEKAAIIGFLGARGGMGTTTLALNTGVILQKKGQDVIVAELNPGRGTMSLELGISNSRGMTNLLGRSLKDIHLRAVDTELVAHASGVRLLLSSYHPAQEELEKAVPQLEAIVGNLAAMCTVLLIDLGSGLRPHVRPVLDFCDLIVLVVEPVFPSNMLGDALLEDLEASGIPREKVQLALVTKMRTSMQMPWRQVQEDLGVELAGIISPAPEQAHQASQSGAPLVAMHRESLVSDQIEKLADHILAHVQP